MASCNGTCWALCGSNCSGQSGGGCIMCGGGTADGSCSCGHDCAGCGGGCTGTSKPSGDDGGGGGCTCGGNCTNGCDSTCSGECTASCGTGCYGEEATNLFNKLKAGLNKKILAEDMNNINKMIQLEANRRKKNTTSQTFTVKEKAASAKIKALQSNLSTIGKATSSEAEQKIKSWKATGQELINKSLEAFAETVSQS